MFHVEQSLRTLEFDKLLEIIADFAHSDASRRAILSISPLGDRKEIEKRYSQIGEIRKMSQNGNPLAISSFPDIAPLLQKVRPEGAVLEPQELSGLRAFLDAALKISEQIRDNEGLLYLKELAISLTGHPDLLKMLKKSIDSEGNILDSASVVLSELRANIKRLENRIRKKLEEIVRDERIAIFLQDTFITQRSGRWVIPVRMDSKGQVPGVVHDVSKSGETAFIEPLKIISLSNELENLIAEAKAEEIRILRNISAKIRDVADEIYTEYGVVVYLDVLNCLAKFADRLGMETPEINDKNVINLVKARHPLLMLALQNSGSQKSGVPKKSQDFLGWQYCNFTTEDTEKKIIKVNSVNSVVFWGEGKDKATEVVPLNVRLGGDNTIMVITGANAGGKTIAIKTVGLLTLMALSGMPVPADSSSNFPLIRNLLVDIGDRQSIENNLSTFSAHVSSIAEIIKTADSNTMVLIDELGTGTDPDEGAAIACAVLEELRHSNALVFATTHLTAIKGFVHKTDGMLNASMEFDEKTLTPLYKLRVGEPGWSYALETARRYGLPASVIEAAKNILGGKKIELDSLIYDLNEKRREYEKALDELRMKQAEIEEKKRFFAEKMAETEQKQKEILTNSYKEAAEIILNTKRQMYALLDELKKKSRDKIRETIKEVETKQNSVIERIRELDKGNELAISIDELQKGDVVFVRSIGYDAMVRHVNCKDSRVRVKAGNIEIEVPLSDIAFKKGVPLEPETGSPKSQRLLGVTVKTVKIEKTDEAISSVINIVGLRVDEALSKIEPFLNQALLYGLSEVIIIHGVGTGILSRTVREYLAEHPLVKKFRGGTQQEGGAGVTVVTMK